MDRTELTVRNMLAAIEAPLYDVGVLSDRGMLPGLDAIPGESVIGRLSLLKYRNARGSHIYIRPSGEHRYSVLDDLSEISLAKLTSDGFTPCAVVETSVGNFQAWLKHPATLPKLHGTIASQTLATRYDADLSAGGWRRFGRLPGFTNCKPEYRRPDGLFPFVRLKTYSGEQHPMADTFVQEIRKLHEDREQQREARHLQASLSPEGKRGSPVCSSSASEPPTSKGTSLPVAGRLRLFASRVGAPGFCVGRPQGRFRGCRRARGRASDTVAGLLRGGHGGMGAVRGVSYIGVDVGDGQKVGRFRSPSVHSVLRVTYLNRSRI